MQEFEKMFVELIDQQKSKLFHIANEIHPNLTEDDLLQPNDFSALEQNPCFRYEEGTLAGLLTAHAAFLALKRDLQEKVQKTIVF